MSSQLPKGYEFGPFRLDVAGRRLLRNEEPLMLTPKAFDTLSALVRKSGHLVCKDSLMKEVWPGISVEESNLSHSIYLLRKALGRDGSGKPYIETIPKHGYRLAMTATELAPTPQSMGPQDQEKSGASLPAAADGARPRRPLRAMLLCAALLLVFFCAAASSFRLLERKRDVRALRTRSIAVLPFQPINVESGHEPLGLAVTDATIKRLSALRQLAVRPTSAVSKYTDRRDDSLSVGRKLGVDAVLEGIVQRSGDDIRLTVQLINVRDGQALWAQKFDARCANNLSVQDAISEQLAEALKRELASREQKELARSDAETPEAYEPELVTSFNN